MFKWRIYHLLLFIFRLKNKETITWKGAGRFIYIYIKRNKKT